MIASIVDCILSGVKLQRYVLICVMMLCSDPPAFAMPWTIVCMLEAMSAPDSPLPVTSAIATSIFPSGSLIKSA